MRRTSPKGQISEALADLSVQLADVTMPVSDLSGGILVVGQTASGKTRSIVNNLAQQFAEMFTRSGAIAKRRQFAIIYFGIKGRGHLEFFEALSKTRRKDVVTLSAAGDCRWVMRLFPKGCWTSAEDLHLAVVNFVEEVAEHVARSRATFRHDPFWDRQRVRLLGELARLETDPDLNLLSITPDIEELVHQDALVSLLARAEAFLEFIGEKANSREKTPTTSTKLREELKDYGLGDPEDLARAERIVSFFAKTRKGGRRTKALCEYLVKTLQRARKPESAINSTLLERFALHLQPSSRQRLHKLVEQWWRIPDITRGVIEADLRGVIQTFRSGPAEQIFRAKKQEITIEEIIDRGLILVIDLPAAEMGNANWPALAALKLAITQRLISRYKAQWCGKPISRRGAVIVQDEAQLLISDSEAKALSVIREFGVTWIFATQSVSLIASVLQSRADTAAFVAAARVRVWGNTGDEFTAEIASRFCGTSRGQPRQLTCLWHPTPLLEAAVTGSSAAETPLVAPQRFYELKTGQFYLTTADNESFFLDLRFSLKTPKSHNLRA